MYYSVYDDTTKKYFYYVAKGPFFVEGTADYNAATFVPWQDAKILLPNDAAPAGSGFSPKGILCHPTEFDSPACRERVDLVWLGLGWLAKWLFF